MEGTEKLDLGVEGSLAFWHRRTCGGHGDQSGVPPCAALPTHRRERVKGRTGSDVRALCFEEIVLALTCLEWRCGHWTLNRRFQVLCTKSSARGLPHVTTHREARVLFKFGMSTFSCAHADFVSSSCDWPEMVTALFHHHLQHRRGECLLPSFLRNGESEHNFNHCRFCKPSLAARAAWATSTRGASSRVSASVPFLPSRPRTSRSAAPRRSGGASPVSSRSWSPSAS